MAARLRRVSGRRWYNSGLSEALGSQIGGAVAGNVITQGIGLATGLQSKFSWAGVAAAGVAAGVGGAAGGRLKLKPFSGPNADVSIGNIAEHAALGAARSIAYAATRSLIDGTDFGDNVRASLPDVIGQTIGESLAGRIASGRSSEPAMAGKEKPYSKGPKYDPKGELITSQTPPTKGAATGPYGKGDDIIVTALQADGTAQATGGASSAAQSDGLPSAIRGLELTRDEYLAAVEDGLWRRLEGNPESGFQSNADVSAATRQVQGTQAVNTADVISGPELAGFVKSISRPTAEARISGSDQEYEKYLTFGRSSSGEIVVTGIELVGRQGGRPYTPAGTYALAHVHYDGLYQPPHGGDDSALRSRGISSFVIGSSGRNVWEVGRVGGTTSIRTVLDNNQYGRWEAYQTRPERYRIYDVERYR